MAAKAQLTSVWRLATQAGQRFWQHAWLLMGLMAVIALPSAILGNIGGLSQDGSFSAYSSFASLIMNVALIWMVTQIVAGRSATIRQAYYDGTRVLVRFLLIIFALTIMLVPFLIGSLIYLSGVSGETLVVSAPEKGLLALIWLVLGAPSLWLLTRFFLSIYALVVEDLTPIAALRRSYELTRGRAGRLAARLIVLALASMVILALPAIAVVIGGSKSSLLGAVLLQVVSTLVILPLANLYLCQLYVDLSRG